MNTRYWYRKREGKAEHLVYLDSEGKELEKLLNGTKTMIIRGAVGKRVPLGGRAKKDDLIYFVVEGSDLVVSYCGVISKVVEQHKMTFEESVTFIELYEKELNLSAIQKEKWLGKKNVGLFEISNIDEIEPFQFHPIKEMDNWVITDYIEDVM